MKIYTKTGDKGETGLADGKRYKKSEEVFWVMGEVDELIAWTGLCISKLLITNDELRINFQISRFQDSKQLSSKFKAQSSKQKERVISKINEDLKRIQRNLFTINSVLARARNIKFNFQKETEWLEKEIDEMTKELPELKNFILPGGSEVAATLHVARAICRRVERRIVMYQCINTMVQTQVGELIRYINRLSDYFFTLARWVNFKLGEKEEKWKR